MAAAWSQTDLVIASGEKYMGGVGGVTIPGVPPSCPKDLLNRQANRANRSHTVVLPGPFRF